MNFIFNIYYNNFNIKINHEDLHNNIIYNIESWKDLNNKLYLTDLIFPNYDKQNIWLNFNSRPFKICPCKYEELLIWSNNSIVNIIINDYFNNIIGFCVLTDKNDFYFINILCTNINKGIGTIIIEFIKKYFVNKPIKLKTKSNSKDFYLKKGFIELTNNIMIYSNNS